MSSKEEFQRKMTRYNTKEMYTQPKYNLLREESEGYSFSFSCRMHPWPQLCLATVSGSQRLRVVEQKRVLGGYSHSRERELWDTPGGRGQSKPFNRCTVAQQ